MKCRKCAEIYVGSTIRPKEHLNNRLPQHTNTWWPAGIEKFPPLRSLSFHTERDPTDVRIKEAITIKRLDPEINRREEHLPIWLNLILF